jgi:hypothetical protein
MTMQKFTQAEKVTPVAPDENERANVLRDAGGLPKLANVRRECQQPDACQSPNCGC